MKNYLLFTILLTSSCSTFKSPLLSSLAISSNPQGAELYNCKAEAETLGITPLEMNAELQSKIFNGEYSELCLKKAGYFPKNIFFISKGITKINLKLDKIDENNNIDYVKKYGMKVLSDTLNTFTKAQDFYYQKKLDDSLLELKTVDNLFPNTIAFLQLEGAIYFQKKNLQAALNVFEKILTIEPDNLSAMSFIQIIKGTNAK